MVVDGHDRDGQDIESDDEGAKDDNDDNNEDPVDNEDYGEEQDKIADGQMEDPDDS